MELRQRGLVRLPLQTGFGFTLENKRHLKKKKNPSGISLLAASTPGTSAGKYNGADLIKQDQCNSYWVTSSGGARLLQEGICN